MCHLFYTVSPGGLTVYASRSPAQPYSLRDLYSSYSTKDKIEKKAMQGCDIVGRSLGNALQAELFAQ